MIAVIFEVTPRDAQQQAYLDAAASLKSELQTMDGFISVERFQSITSPERFLSLSFWRDENAVAGWRNSQSHRAVQDRGRNAIFEDYRLRVASVVRDYGMFERNEAPSDSRARHK